MPQHFRNSELAEPANHNSFKISERLKPQIDIDGITLKTIKIDPKTPKIHRKYAQTSFDNNNESVSKQIDEEYYLQDQWKFGGTNIWKDLMSNTVSEWNILCN